MYLYCLLNGKKVRACAPTGIAAANIELEGTVVSASTLHCFFDFDGCYESRLDFSKTTNEKVDAVINLDVLMLDEVSMLDTDIWEAMTKILGLADHARHRGFRPESDEYGSVHLVLFGPGLCCVALGSSLQLSRFGKHSLEVTSNSCRLPRRRLPSSRRPACTRRSASAC